MDASGFLEKMFAALWGTFLALTPATITWALLVNHEASLPTIGQLLFWLGLNRDPLQMILGKTFLSVPATVGGMIIGGCTFFIVHSLHLLVQMGSITYRRFSTAVKGGFINLMNLARRAIARIGRGILRKKSSA